MYFARLRYVNWFFIRIYERDESWLIECFIRRDLMNQQNPLIKSCGFFTFNLLTTTYIRVSITTASLWGTSTCWFESRLLKQFYVREQATFVCYFLWLNWYPGLYTSQVVFQDWQGTSVVCFPWHSRILYGGLVVESTSFLTQSTLPPRYTDTEQCTNYYVILRLTCCTKCKWFTNSTKHRTWPKFFTV